MPHSSGGGSHGGGHHSGSRGSSGSADLNMFKHFRTVRVSRHDYGSPYRYVYYRNHKMHCVYANEDVKDRPLFSSAGAVVVSLIVLAILVCVWASVLSGKKPLKQDYNNTIMIEDNLGVIKDENALRSSLGNFRTVTGITPAVLTVNDSDWKNSGKSLEKYAYDRYVNAFSDEKHWLIVYSLPDNVNSDFVDWSWEGMQGDDTDLIITERVAEDFNKEFHDSLVRENTVEKSLIGAFDMTAGKCMKGVAVNDDILIFIVVISYFAVYFCVYILKPDLSSIKYRHMAEVPLNSVAVTCDYCGGQYMSRTVQNCPHCGGTAKIYSN